MRARQEPGRDLHLDERRRIEQLYDANPDAVFDALVVACEGLDLLEATLDNHLDLPGTTHPGRNRQVDGAHFAQRVVVVQRAGVPQRVEEAHQVEDRPSEQQADEIADEIFGRVRQKVEELVREIG